MMDKSDLLFYDAYQEFYRMAAGSLAFQAFCKDAFGEDFSQDGFSDINQIDRILEYIPTGEDVHILDIGCGNGKMLGYLQKKTDGNHDGNGDQKRKDMYQGFVVDQTDRKGGQHQHTLQDHDLAQDLA